ncbi:hypothetical protein EX30DRAFT_393686 [Ascodesmis nigricans]|uniref:Uncharacterized protein n=1 Tax=Ascodesmis nigricans TaxID=341454 RepID=A0A4S2N4J6_9PEZI|nr:hypothetical protein EX30DRAFT_393686 [Ascodesmis nigricans]
MASSSKEQFHSSAMDDQHEPLLPRDEERDVEQQFQSTVNALPNRWSRFFREHKKQIAHLLVFIYFLTTLIITSVCARIDDRYYNTKRLKVFALVEHSIEFFVVLVYMAYRWSGMPRIRITFEPRRVRI